MKMYPFSARQHAHDIELVKNYAFNNDNIPLFQEASELLTAIGAGMRGYTGVTMLSGPMIGRAKLMVAMAAEIRQG